MQWRSLSLSPSLSNHYLSDNNDDDIRDKTTISSVAVRPMHNVLLFAQNAEQSLFIKRLIVSISYFFPIEFSSSKNVICATLRRGLIQALVHTHFVH